MNLPTESGIYLITNSVTGSQYVGKSVNIHRRVLQHFCQLNSGNHYNTYLQRAWDKYGNGAFDVSVLELCDKSELDNKEVMYIEKYDTYHNGYNLTLVGDGGHGVIVSDETRQKLRLARSATWRSVVLLNTGDVFECVADAARQYHTDSSSITMCCNHIRRYAGVFDNQKLVWSYYDDYIKFSKDDIRTLILQAEIQNKGGYCEQAKGVVLLNTGEVFDCVTTAAEHFSISPSQISRVCVGKGLRAGTMPDGTPMVWRHYSDYERMSASDIDLAIDSAMSANKGSQHFNSKRVLLTNTGEVFESISDASRIYGVSVKGISACCTGKKKSCGKLDGVKMVWQHC